MVIRVKLIVDCRNFISEIIGGESNLLFLPLDPADNILFNEAVFMREVMKKRGYRYDPEKPLDEIDWDEAMKQNRLGNIVALNFIKEVSDR